jgi:hypothetical protein
MRTDEDFKDLRFRYGSPRVDRWLYGTVFALWAPAALVSWFRPRSEVGNIFLVVAATFGAVTIARQQIRMLASLGFETMVRLALTRWVLNARFMAWIYGWPASDDTSKDRRASPFALGGLGLFVLAMLVIVFWG